MITIQTNLPDLKRQMAQIGQTVQRKLVRSATGAAAREIANAARSAIRMRTTRRSGTLQRAVFIARLRRSPKGSEMYRVAIRRGASARTRKTKAGSSRIDAFYWYWVDQGHITRPAKALAGGRRTRTLQRQRIRAAGGWVEGRFFMRDAFLRGRGQAVTAFYRRFDRDFKAQVR